MWMGQINSTFVLNYCSVFHSFLSHSLHPTDLVFHHHHHHKGIFWVPFLTKNQNILQSVQHKAKNKLYNNITSQSHRPCAHTDKSKAIIINNTGRGSGPGKATYTDITPAVPHFMCAHAFFLHTCTRLCGYHYGYVCCYILDWLGVCIVLMIDSTEYLLLYMPSAVTNVRYLNKFAVSNVRYLNKLGVS